MHSTRTLAADADAENNSMLEILCYHTTGHLDLTVLSDMITVLHICSFHSSHEHISINSYTSEY